MLFMAALASSVVASMETVRPLINSSSARIFSTQPNTALWVSSAYKRRVREIVEWSGVALTHFSSPAGDSPRWDAGCMHGDTCTRPWKTDEARMGPALHLIARLM